MTFPLEFLTILVMSGYADSTSTPLQVDTYSTSSLSVALLISLLFRSVTESRKSKRTQHWLIFCMKSSCCSEDGVSGTKGGNGRGVHSLLTKKKKKNDAAYHQGEYTLIWKLLGFQIQFFCKKNTNGHNIHSLLKKRQQRPFSCQA